jgi:hypothetical protein
MGFARVQMGQPVERLVEREKLVRPVWRELRSLIQPNLRRATAALFGPR